ncbi:hypothetical protein CPB83DRAFT_849385 [Crepidotus variabilis]|uniref:WW domain-containing protein n=1 Tax=Crepidotus variabilis TaxID=179855 RepID=A0A9P6EL65_9AGAR|nr:hypothetical protein CPB83DRAFT_849385 [Crepidotus variabilis]
MSPVNSPKLASDELKESGDTEVHTSASPTSEEAPKETVQKDESGSKSKSPQSEPDSEDEESKSPEKADTESTPAPQWQAVWAPQYNAYYFYNPVTQETTWTNPLQPEASGSSSLEPAAAETSSSANTEGTDAEAEASSSKTPATSAVVSQYAAMQAAALAQGIDPLLAHLDPTLRNSVQGTSGTLGDVPTFTAQFNAQTGKFAPTSSRTPGHLSEYERAKRMSEFYFDVNQWEQDLAKDQQEEEEAGKKRKRPTKKDIERFKEQKKQKKIAKTAWLRS